MIRDGDAFDAASVNDRLDELVSQVNDVPLTAIRRHGLRREHLPGVLASDLFPNGFTAARDLNTTYESYENTFSGDWTPSVTIDFQAYSAGAPSAPYGATTVAETDGWRIPAISNSSADAAEITLLTGGFSLDDVRLHGIFVHFNIEIGEALISSGFGTADFQDCIYLGIGFEDSSGARCVIEDSIVPFSKRATARGSLSIWWYITQDDLDEYGDGTIEKIHAVIAGHSVVTNTNNQWDFEVGSFCLSAWPFHAGDLE